MSEKQKLIVKVLSDKGYGFAATEDGREIYLDRSIVLNVTGLYTGREIWARIDPPKVPGKNPIARDVQFEPPKPTPADYNPTFTPEEEDLFRLFVELKTRYHLLRLSRPLPALDESLNSWAEEFLSQRNAENDERF